VVSVPTSVFRLPIHFSLISPFKSFMGGRRALPSLSIANLATEEQKFVDLEDERLV
jgi:hypothetical protein